MKSKTKIEATQTVRQLNYALEFFDVMTKGVHDTNSDLAQLARIAEENGLPKTAEVLREHAPK